MADHEREDAAMTRDEAALAPFFESARRAGPVPRIALLNAIIADAAEVQAGRLPARGAPAAPRLRRGAPALGWAAAFAACLAVGFVAGLAGGADRGTEALLAEESPDSPGEAVDAFFDLAALEG